MAKRVAKTCLVASPTAIDGGESYIVHVAEALAGCAALKCRARFTLLS